MEQKKQELLNKLNPLTKFFLSRIDEDKLNLEVEDGKKN